jgi:hypothetical protein
MGRTLGTLGRGRTALDSVQGTRRKGRCRGGWTAGRPVHGPCEAGRRFILSRGRACVNQESLPRFAVVGSVRAGIIGRSNRVAYWVPQASTWNSPSQSPVAGGGVHVWCSWTLPPGAGTFWYFVIIFVPLLGPLVLLRRQAVRLFALVLARWTLCSADLAAGAALRAEQTPTWPITLRGRTPRRAQESTRRRTWAGAGAADLYPLVCRPRPTR